MERLFDISDDDPNGMQRLVRLYLNTTTEQLKKLSAAISENRTSEVEQIAHSCAGSSSMAGMMAMIPPLRALEALGAKKDLSGATSLLQEAQHAFTQTQAYLESNALTRKT